jgi:hypothetical protein
MGGASVLCSRIAEHTSPGTLSGAGLAAWSFPPYSCALLEEWQSQGDTRASEVKGGSDAEEKRREAHHKTNRAGAVRGDVSGKAASRGLIPRAHGVASPALLDSLKPGFRPPIRLLQADLPRSPRSVQRPATRALYRRAGSPRLPESAEHQPT